jgi:EAL domain-containing protein (putative c-di-GMP-specific phosphodiesterase class I)
MINNREVFVRASIGAADTTAAGSREAGELLRDADLAMYLAKSSGRNQVAIFTAGIDTVVRDRAQLSEDLRLALGRGEFEVHYQPVIVGEELTMSGVEALLRWHHPTRGLVSPSEFVPLAEETGEIRAIGNWVLMTAARQIAEWQRTLPGCAELNLAVNLSPVQLRDPDLLSHLWNALHSSGLSPTRLTLEVTEGMLLADLDLARRQLDAARALGTKVSIDDFGTGYSSLSYLAQLPADEVKIDRSFVEALSPDDNSIALVKGIVDLASALNLEVLAEGVEARSQQDILTDLGCPRSQGFLYSQALAVGDFAAATEAFRAVPTIDATTIDATTIDVTAIDTTIDAATDHPTERMPRA